MKQTLLFFLLLLPLVASADDSGPCGDGLTYNYVESTHTLTISKTGEGTGKMNNFYYDNRPWSSYCDEIVKVVIESGVTSIGNNAFHGCSALTSVDIPEGVTSIGYGAFSSCSGLTSVDIPEGMTSIGDYAFADCSGLTSVDIPKGVTSIGNRAFESCISLTSVGIPAGVTSIGNNAFCNCDGLTSVDIPSGVTSIGYSAFSFCDRLTSVTIPEGVTTINEGTFQACTRLNSLSLPDGLKNIKQRAFQYCYELKTLTIPASVEGIYSEAFDGCSLEVINAQPTAPPFIYNNTFSSYTAQLNVLSGSITAYKEANYWKNFENISDGNMNYQLTLTATEGGTIVYGEQRVTATTKTFDVKEGSSFMLNITPASGYELTTLSLNGVAAQFPVSGGALMLSSIRENTTVVATFALEQKDELAIKMSVADGDSKTMGYSSPYGLDFTTVKGVTAWTVSGITGKGEVQLSNVKVVPPNTGVILMSDVAGVEVNVPTTTEDAQYTKLLRPVVSEEVTAPKETVNSEEYMNFVVGTLTNGDPGFVRLAQSSTLGPNGVRLLVPSRFNNDVVESQGGLKMVYELQGDMNGDKKLTPADAIMVLYRYFGADTGNGARATRPAMTPE
ncbi:MAG: leucine-rich repeat domain-containing protein [Prevotella sp.]|nr:leucine-rich repeat domain-containing protein [Prevotella sp.]